MHLLENIPRFDLEEAQKVAGEFFGVHAQARQLPSERDQNFLLNDSGGEKFVLKVANALEKREFLEAQNAVLKHLSRRVSFCQTIVPGVSGEEIATVELAGAAYLVRLVRYLPGMPLAEIRPHSSELLRDLGRAIGQLAQALRDFDHPAAHRDFHWDLANGNRVLDEFAPLIEDGELRELVLRCRVGRDLQLRQSVIHGDANDYNVLVDPELMTVSGLLDFGDMVYSYTAGELAIAMAYVVLDKDDPFAAGNEVVRGYTEEFALLPEEIEALWPLVRLRLGMSVCVSAYQHQQQPNNEYLCISQKSIEKSLPRLFGRGLDG